MQDSVFQHLLHNPGSTKILYNIQIASFHSQKEILKHANLYNFIYSVQYCLKNKKKMKF